MDELEYLGRVVIGAVYIAMKRRGADRDEATEMVINVLDALPEAIDLQDIIEDRMAQAGIMLTVERIEDDSE